MKRLIKQASLWGLIVCLLIPRVTVNAQSLGFAVDIVSVRGSRLDNNIVFAGKVINTLPWDISDVEITVFFPDEDISTKTVVEQVPSGESADFLAVMTYREGLGSFVTYVSDYSFETNDVSRLLRLFWANNDDFVLRSIAPKVFSTMTPSAWPGLLACVAVDERPAEYPDTKTILNDLLCLEGIRATGSVNEAQAVLDLLAWYETQEALDLLEIRFFLREEEDTILDNFPILTGRLHDDINMPTLIQYALQDMGIEILPTLLLAETSPSAAVQEVAKVVVQDMQDEDLLAALSHEDPDAFEDLLAYFQENNRVDNTIELLEVLDQLEDSQLRTKTMDCILSFDGEAVPYLVDALEHPNIGVADQAEEMLGLLGEPVLPALSLELSERGLSLPSEQNTQAAIQILRENADQAVLDKVESVFQRGLPYYQQGDCAQAVQVYQDIFEIRDPVPIHSEEIAAAFNCAGNNLYAAGDPELAREYFLQSLQLAPGNTQASQGMIRDFLRTHPVYRWGGISALLILCVMGLVSTRFHLGL